MHLPKRGDLLLKSKQTLGSKELAELDCRAARELALREVR